MSNASDRELLELAARAGGIEGSYFRSDNPIHCGIYQARGEYYWNPLASSSEALRLAAKLEISVHIQAFRIGASAHGFVGYPGGWHERTLDNEKDYRRAIVRAAAQIGRARTPAAPAGGNGGV